MGISGSPKEFLYHKVLVLRRQKTGALHPCSGARKGEEGQRPVKCFPVVLAWAFLPLLRRKARLALGGVQDYNSEVIER